MKHYIKTLLLIMFVSGALKAQNDMIANVNMQFRFANPGARAKAMGGAFVGLADDHTAMFANPAGLTNLRQRTFSIEVAHIQNDGVIPFYKGEILQPQIQDLIFDLDTENFPEKHLSIPFAGMVIPGEKWTFGFFYAKQADTSRSFSTDSIRIQDVPFEIRPVMHHQSFYFFPSDNTLKLELESIGTSMGWRMSEALSIGGTLGISRLNYQGSTVLKIPVFQEAELQFLEPVFGETIARIDTDGKDTALSAILGLLYSPNERFRFGVTYQYEPSFSYDFTVSARNLITQPPSLTDFEIEEEGSSSFHVPNHLSVGMSMQSSESFLLSFEIKRIFYSELEEDFHHFFQTNGNEQTVDDGTEYHFGMEYFFLNSSIPFSLRCGYWFEPYHALTNTLADTQIIFRDEAGELGVRNSIFLQRFAHDLNHITLGFGMAIAKSIQLDAALDFSDESRDASISGTYRF